MIIGQHFGTEADLDQVVSIGGRACKETKWISVTNLECIGPASFTNGTKALVQVNVAQSTSKDSDGVTVEYVDTNDDNDQQQQQSTTSKTDIYNAIDNSKDIEELLHILEKYAVFGLS